MCISTDKRLQNSIMDEYILLLNKHNLIILTRKSCYNASANVNYKQALARIAHSHKHDLNWQEASHAL